MRLCKGKGIFFLSILFLLLIIPSTTLANLKQQCNSQYVVHIGSGRQDGLYYKFVNEWSEFNNNKKKNELCVFNRKTDGSINNLELIEGDRLSFAIVQNDIGHHIYYGLHGKKENLRFEGLRPLFKEYVQIVYLKNDEYEIKTISDLSGKRIAAGAEGSGGYRNAIDLLHAAGMSEGFDFMFVANDSGKHPVELLQQKKADVAIYTRATPHKIIAQEVNNKFGFLAIPKSAVKKLSISMRKPYYAHGDLLVQTAQGKKLIPSISVIAYLVVNDQISDVLVSLVQESLDDFIKYSSEKNIFSGAVTYESETIADYPFDMHYLYYKHESRQTIRNWFLLTIAEIPSIFFYLLFAFIVMGLITSHQIARYDSLGLIKSNSFFHKCLSALYVFFNYAFSLVIWLLVVQAVATFIMHRENLFAIERGIESPLDGFDIWDRTIWLIKLAYTNLPGEVPLSPLSAMLIPLVALLGLGSFVWVFYKVSRTFQNKHIARMKGVYVHKRLTGHVLICGWNSSAPGVIYSLISKYAPERKKVVVIAEMDIDMPLVEYGFDSKLVFYVKGDSADMEVLRRARAQFASEAMVLAGDKKIESDNIGSILTVIALRKLGGTRDKDEQSPLFIGAELKHVKNKEAFLKAGADELVCTKELSDRIAALSLVSHEAPDFIIDFLTYDNFFELYQGGISEISNKFKANTLNLQEGAYTYQCLEKALLQSGINMLGAFQRCNVTGNHQFLFKNVNCDNSTKIYPQDQVIYFSNDKSDIRKARKLKYKFNMDSQLPEIETFESKKNVVIIGEKERAENIKQLINHKFVSVTVITNEEFKGYITGPEYAMDENVLSDKFKGIDSVLILSEINNESPSKQTNNSYSDTTSLLIIGALNNLRVQNQYEMKIIAELDDYQSRELFMLSGADQIIPRRILFERVFAKMVFNHGKMYELLLKLVTPDDGVYLCSYKVKAGDCFVGKELKELLLANAANYKICGWLPNRYVEYLGKQTMGFGSHFITGFNNKKINRHFKNTYIEENDILILLYKDIEPEVMSKY